MELRHARAFLAVAEEQHFGRAAERLHLAQPALSHQIKQLERLLGVTLFDRTTRRVSITDAGERFTGHARRLVAQAEHAVEDMGRVASGLLGRVAVGFIGTATYDVLPRLALEVRHSLPGIDLDLHGELLSPRLLDGLAAFEYDLVVHRPEPGPRDGVDTTHLRSERLVAVLPSGHRLAGRSRIALSELASDPFVMHPAGGRSSMHAHVLAACADAGFRPVSTVEVAETATLVVFVAAGLGVALVPDPVRSLGLTGVRFVPLRRTRRVDLAVSLRDGGPVAAERVAAVLRDCVD